MGMKLHAFRKLGSNNAKLYKKTSRMLCVNIAVIIMAVLIMHQHHANALIDPGCPNDTAYKGIIGNSSPFIVKGYMLKCATIKNGIIHLTLEPDVPTALLSLPGKLSISVGMPEIRSDLMCKYVTKHASNECTQIFSQEDFPLLVSAPTPSNVVLSSQNIPDWAVVRFMPNKITATPNGTAATMILYGAMLPLHTHSPKVTTFDILAKSSSSQTYSYSMPIVKSGLIVLHSIEPIPLSNYIVNDINGRSFSGFGVLYAPLNSSLPVHFSIDGLKDGNKTGPLPSWLGLTFSKMAFVLNSMEPYYFTISQKTDHAIPGDYTVAINEAMDGTSFVQNYPINVQNMTAFHPANSTFLPITILKPRNSATLYMNPVYPPPYFGVCLVHLQPVRKAEEQLPGCARPEATSILA